MPKRKTALSLDLLNERAAAEFYPDEANQPIAQNLQLLPLEDILDRPHQDARPLNNQHVESLVDSILALGLISPLTVDCKGHLLAGRHRRAALHQIAIEKVERFDELFPLGIPVRVMEIDASSDEIDALQIEIEENTQRRNFTAAEIRDAALRLEKAGYERLRGRPKLGQKSLKRELANVFRLSEDRIQRILNNSEQKGRRTPTFSPEVAISMLERWIKELDAPESPQQEKVKKQMQALMKGLKQLT